MFVEVAAISVFIFFDFPFFLQRRASVVSPYAEIKNPFESEFLEEPG